MLPLTFSVKHGWYTSTQNWPSMSTHPKYAHTSASSFKQFTGKRARARIQLGTLTVLFLSSLRKVKLDQRKLTDNVNAVSDIARVRHINTHPHKWRCILVAIIGVWYCCSNVNQSDRIGNKTTRLGYTSVDSTGEIADQRSSKMNDCFFLYRQSHIENLPQLMATAVNEQNNRLWERLETHVQTQLTTIRPAQALPMISVTGPQRQNTVWWEYFHKRMFFLKKKYKATGTDSRVIFF